MDRSPSALQTFGRLRDSKWLKILKRSIKEPMIDGVRLPGFPSSELQRQTVGSDYEHTLGEAFKFYTYAKDACARYGVQIQQRSRILDFGVSWGRIIRFFLKDVEPEGLHSVDTNTEFLRAAQQTNVPGQLHQISPLGRLPYAEQFFDLVYAYSVFTHLPEHVQDHWLAEIARTLKPGAIFIATVEPPRFLEFFAPLDPEDKTLHPWHAAMARKIRADTGLSARLQASGFVYIPDEDGIDEVYGDCVMTPAYIREHWGRYFEIIDYLDDRKRFWQAVVVARKRGVNPSSAHPGTDQDLRRPSHVGLAKKLLTKLRRQRPPSYRRSRRETLLSRIDISTQVGLEIGPLSRPIVTKTESNNRIFYVDWATADELRAKYRNDPCVTADAIVETDFLWGHKACRNWSVGNFSTTSLPPTSSSTCRT